MSELNDFEPSTLEGFLPLMVAELSISARQISAVVTLLDEGATLPFIARYRKEAHGNLDEVQIGKIQERLLYYRELEARKATILKSIDDQEKLTPELKAQVIACTVRATLEDLYLPYKPKRRTRAMIAREKGLEPLAQLILAQDDTPHDATAFVNESVESETAAWAGARDIIAEMVSESADVRGFARQQLAERGVVKSEVVDPAPTLPTKFEQYYDYEEAIGEIPSHRFLAIRRGETEGVLRVSWVCDPQPILDKAMEAFGYVERAPLGPELKKAIEEAWRRLIKPSIEIDVAVELKQKSDVAAVEVFAENLRHLLLQAPLGERVVLGVDPGIRTGCKLAMLDATGKFLTNTTIYLSQGDYKELEASVELCKMISRYTPEAIAVGNGTAGRETEAFVRRTLAKADAKEIIVVSVSEAGASVYSASEVARKEFPDLDLTVRGAISIGRRLQDPLAELVKIDPKAIGVGQYQHDVNQTLLAAKLDEVIVSCVNHVGVELNTASVPLLTRVAGLTASIAEHIVAWRNEHGAFTARAELLRVPGLGPRTYEQAAGFLRIRGAVHPLDRSAVHPERYALVEQMASDVGVTVEQLVGNTEAINKIQLKNYLSDTVGEPTLRDILDELRKPGRDPRAAFEPPAFREDVCTIEDVKPGMKLEGIVSNVTAFGAFVDIGVHQDGLVHVSELSDHYVRDPAEVVKTGDKIKVTVLEVDIQRKRISLSAKSKPSSNPRPSGPRPSGRPTGMRPTPPSSRSSGFTNNPFANL